MATKETLIDFLANCIALSEDDLETIGNIVDEIIATAVSTSQASHPVAATLEPAAPLYDRAYFAAHAPSEIPDWFDACSVPDPRTKLNNSDYNHAADWISGDKKHLPEHLTWFSDAWHAYNKALNDMDREDADSQRYFAWRTYYADRMLTFLNEPPIEK